MNYTVIRKKERLPIHTAAVYPSPYHKKSSMEYVQFVLKEPVLLRIRSQIRVESVLIRPLSLGLVPVMDNGDILLYLDHPVKLSLEINGGAQDNLLVLAEEERYAELRTQDPRVKYFPAGVHKTDILTIDQDHTVVYLEEGACVHGKLVLSRCSHVTVCGYGVICMEQYPYESRPLFARCVDAIECQDVTIRDITIMDSNDWSLRICGCQDVVVDNVKIFGCRGNSDGIDICGSKRVLVQNAFTRVWDDSLVVKALDTGDVEDVTFRNCILWNDFARPMEVGVELRADRVCGVTFENIDVLHSPTGYPLMGIHHGDRAAVSDMYLKILGSRMRREPSCLISGSPPLIGTGIPKWAVSAMCFLRISIWQEGPDCPCFCRNPACRAMMRPIISGVSPLKILISAGNRLRI